MPPSCDQLLVSTRPAPVGGGGALSASCLHSKTSRAALWLGSLGVREQFRSPLAPFCPFTHSSLRPPPVGWLLCPPPLRGGATGFWAEDEAEARDGCTAEEDEGDTAGRPCRCAFVCVRGLGGEGPVFFFSAVSVCASNHLRRVHSSNCLGRTTPHSWANTMTVISA